MRALFLLAAGLVAGGAATSQELAPEVLLLSRVKRHIEEELKALPNISCLETVHREQKAVKGKMQPLDTVRLEVLSDGHKEQFASPGDRNFSDQPPISYAGTGTLGNGFFGLYLRTVLVAGNVSYSYKGEVERGGRRLAQWDYRLPVQFSGQTFHLQQGSGRVSLQGSFFADAKTHDVTRLTVEAGDFPPTPPVNEANWSIDYALTSLGGGRAALLPASAEFRMVMFSGEATLQRFGFTKCRIFGAQSTITLRRGGHGGRPGALRKQLRSCLELRCFSSWVRGWIWGRGCELYGRAGSQPPGTEISLQRNRKHLV